MILKLMKPILITNKFSQYIRSIRIFTMTRIESEKTSVNQPANVVFDFLSDFNNFQKLMPEQVTNWESNQEEGSFTIKGMASLGMKISEKQPSNLIKIIRHGKAPFDFDMLCEIADKGPQSEVQLIFNADLNPMLKMMAVKPLTNFMNMLAKNIAQLHA